MKRRVLQVIAICSAIIAICFGGFAIYKMVAITHAESVYQKIGDILVLNPVDQIVGSGGSQTKNVAIKRSPKEVDEMFLNRQVQFDSLVEQNPDVWGWISIPNTAIDYPIMLEHSPSSSFYLWRGLDRQKNSIGSLFVYPSPTPEVEDAHTLIFGHRLTDSKLMFSELPNYHNREYCDEHPFIYLYRKGVVQKWKVWIAKNVFEDDSVYKIPYVLGSDAYASLLTSLRQDAPYEAATAPSRNDRILVCSTCDKDFSYAEGRFLVVAVLEEERRN